MAGLFSFTYPLSPYNLPTNAPVQIDPSFNTPPSTLTLFSILPSTLPNGLSFDPNNAIILGTTLFSSLSPPIIYTVTATENNIVIATTTLTISVSFAPQFSYPYSPYILQENIATTPSSSIYPIYFISNLTGTTYSEVSTSYPTLADASLNLNTTTGVISGTPMLAFPIKTFIIRAINNNIPYEASLTISVQPIPTINYPQEAYKLTQEVPVSILPVNQNQFNVSYSIIGCSYIPTTYNLPVGLVFNTTTGEISGTPTMLFPPSTYIVTITNLIGSSETTITLNVIKEFLAPPMVADNFSSNTFLTNPTIEMRRKAEILKYKKNSANLTKQQQYALLAQNKGPYTPRSFGNQGPTNTNPNIGNFPQVGNSLICNSNQTICAPTSSSDVPGPVMNLCYNPAVPLVGYNPPNKFRVDIGFKWPFRSWQRGDNGFPVGKEGRG